MIVILLEIYISTTIGHIVIHLLVQPKMSCDVHKKNIQILCQT